MELTLLAVMPGLLIWLAILLLPWRPWSTRESLDSQSPENLDLSNVTVLIPAGEIQAHYFRSDFRVVEKKFVEVAHAIEQKFIRVLGLDSQVLAHHWRMLIGCWGAGRQGGQHEPLWD